MNPPPAGPSTPPPSAGPTTIGFAKLAQNDATVATHAESGFIISPTSSEWRVRTTYGNPAPFVQFWSQAGDTTTGTIEVAAGVGVAFTFQSIDLYSSTTPIPYVIAGIHESATVFEVAGTLPNTFGDFAPVQNPRPTTLIDVLVVTLTNQAAPCCRNPMGVDNIALDVPMVP